RTSYLTWQGQEIEGLFLGDSGLHVVSLHMVLWPMYIIRGAIYLHFTHELLLSRWIGQEQHAWFSHFQGVWQHDESRYDQALNIFIAPNTPLPSGYFFCLFFLMH
ncbi:hypothetical protein ACJX0J_036179, partial [Zea mays]